MDYEAYLDELTRAGSGLADAAAEAGLDADVPTCPDWDVRALLDHTGMIHRWAAANVRSGAERGEPYIENAPADGVLDWFRDGHERLVQTLRETDPDAPCWAFLAGAPKTATFWARRQAHETSVHRADAESACGRIPSVDPAFALDGLAELLEGFYGRRGGRLVSDPPFTLRVAPSDADVSWLITVRPEDRVVERDGDGEAQCAVSGPSPDLYLHLWNRTPAAPVALSGDRSVLDRWKELARVTWG